MGFLWRLLAPRSLKRARRAMHPTWIAEDAIVRAARGKRRKRGKVYRHAGCPVNHRTPEAMWNCRR